MNMNVRTFVRAALSVALASPAWTSISHTIVVRDHLTGHSTRRVISATLWDSTSTSWTGSDTQPGILGLPTPAFTWIPNVFANRRPLSPLQAAVGWPGRICVRVDIPPFLRLDTTAQRCSGALVSPHFVLTAAHCVVQPFTLGSIQEGWVTDSVLVRPGYNLRQDAPGFRRVRVIRSYVSESKFDSGVPYPGDNEWALLELDQDVGSKLGWARVVPIHPEIPTQMVHAMGYPLIPLPCGGDANCDSTTKTDTLMHSWQTLDYYADPANPYQEWVPSVPGWEGESGSGYFKCQDDSCRQGKIDVIGVRWTNDAISSVDSVMAGVIVAILKDDVRIPTGARLAQVRSDFDLAQNGARLTATALQAGEWQIMSVDGRAIAPSAFGRDLSVPMDRLPRGVVLVVFRTAGQAPIVRRWLVR